MFGMENQLEDVRIPQLLALLIQDQLVNVECLHSLDKNVIRLKENACFLLCLKHLKKIIKNVLQ